MKPASSSSEGPVCDSGADIGKTSEVFRMKSCLCSAALAASNLLPYVGPGVKKQIEKYLGSSMKKSLSASVTRLSKSTAVQVSVGAIGLAEQKLLESKLGQVLIKTNKILKTDVKDLSSSILNKNSAVASADAALVTNLASAEKELGKKSMDDMADVIEGMSSDTRDDFIATLSKSTPKHTPELIKKALDLNSRCQLKLGKAAGKTAEELELVKNECLKEALKELK